MLLYRGVALPRGSAGVIDRPHASSGSVHDLWSLVHREFGPVSTFTSEEDAERELAAVLADEPSWAGDLRVEPFVFRVSAAD